MRFQKSRKQFRLATPMTVIYAMILTACAAEQTPPPVATAAPSQTRPLACADFPPLYFNAGNPNANWGSVKALADAHPSNASAYARNELGDTLSTRHAISNYMAARRALNCQP